MMQRLPSKTEFKDALIKYRELHPINPKSEILFNIILNSIDYLPYEKYEKFVLDESNPIAGYVIKDLLAICNGDVK